MPYMVTFTINIPQMLAYIPAPWILWDLNSLKKGFTVKHIMPRGHWSSSHGKERWFATSLVDMTGSMKPQQRKAKMLP